MEYETGIKPENPIPATPLLLNGTPVGTYEITAEGKMVLKIDQDKRSEVDQMDPAKGYVSFKTIAKTDEHGVDKEIYFGPRRDKIVVKAREELEVKKDWPKYDSATRTLSYTLRINSRTGTKNEIDLEDTLDIPGAGSVTFDFIPASFRLVKERTSDNHKEDLPFNPTITGHTFKATLPVLKKGYRYLVHYDVKH
ncbi:hypothetical protein, partial [Histophilus somni]|uniref:hypothetical protein n=1 Tax=Histophilus somni TaxID=731 RepID=UPI00201FA707